MAFVPRTKTSLSGEHESWHAEGIRRKGIHMEQTRFEEVKSSQEQEPKSRKIEPDWTESEWFQIWLKLARDSYSDAKTGVAH